MAGFVTINGQQIPWTFIMLVRKAAAGDWNRTIDAFWKARHMPAPDGVIKYICKGLIADKLGVRYILKPSAELEAGKMDVVKRWWYALYDHGKKVSRTNDIMRDMLTTIIGKDTEHNG